MNTAKRKGTSWETAIVNFLRLAGVHGAERRALAGSADRGDIAGIPGVMIEAKSCAKIELGSWMAEVRAEVVNAGAKIGAAWIKRRGRTSPGEGYVIVTGDTFVTLLTEAGYIQAPSARPSQSPVEALTGPDGYSGMGSEVPELLGASDAA